MVNLKHYKQMKKPLLLFVLITSCSVEPIEKPLECECTESYWQYLEPRAYQLMKTREVGCVDEISIADAASHQPQGSDVISIECKSI